jgi:Cytochrome c7 and related cytochrome c/Class III cytochrome C family
MRRLPLVVLPALALTGVLFFVAVLAPLILSHQPRPAAAQPIPFDHRVHVEQAGIDCAFCHRTAGDGRTAGLPDVEQCMFCHQVVGQGDPEVERIRQAWASQEPVDWVRVHRLPDHVQFTHQAHIQAGVSCAACHGDVGQMRQVTQVRPLNMSDCVDCHKANNAPTDCVTCHY